MKRVADAQGRTLAHQIPDGDPAVYACTACPVLLQRTPEGSIVDGVAQHYKTVHGREFDTASTSQEST